MSEKSSKKDEKPILVWLDYEMTGLDPDACDIIQMALVLTDTELNQIDRPLEVTIWQPPSVLETMSPYVRKMHTRNGLLDAVGNSQISLEEAEHEALALVSKHASYRTARLCGNSITQDRRFMAKYMPALEQYLHYRQIDVSSLKELALWWYGKKFRKDDQGKHTAMVDILQSIEELKFYRENVML